MAKNLIRANAKELTSRGGRARDVALDSSCNINNNGGSLYALDVPGLLNPIYASAKQVNFQCKEYDTGYNSEGARFQFSTYQTIYHPTTSINEAIFARPASWSSSVNIVMPAGFAAGKTITGNDGQQYVEMRDSVTGEVVSHLGQYSCMKVDADVFNPLKRTTQSLRDEGQHFDINYKISADGKVIPRTESEKAFREMMVDLDNRATKLPNQLDMIRIITNDVVSANNPQFQSAAKADIKTSVAPAPNFTGVAEGVTSPIQSVILKPNAKPTPWVMPVSQNDGLKFELQA